MPVRPKILLAFANNHQFLDKLKRESSKIYQTLLPLENRGILRIIREESAETNDISFFLNHYKDQFIIFHYAGHASQKKLSFEDGNGNIQGLSQLLGLQRKLKLVFLNACATYDQVEDLLEAGVKIVIATTLPVRDDQAYLFSHNFYEALANNHSIKNSYKIACGALKTKYKGFFNHDSIIQAKGLKFQNAPKEKENPWRLYYNQGNSDLLDQTIQTIPVELFHHDLPPLPKSIGIPLIPYKGLDWFTKDDARIFFGRSREIGRLYEQINNGFQRVILLFGQSGVGKSSLLGAGVLPRLDSQWTCIYHRRNQNSGMIVDISSLGSETSQQKNKPRLFVLDQLEEMFNFPNPKIKDEPWRFFQMLEKLLQEDADLKIILSFRKESLAEIQNFLQEFNLRWEEHFLEPLSPAGLLEAIIGINFYPKLKHTYKLEMIGGMELAREIADDVSADKDSHLAPQLQMLLRKMWDLSKKKNYGSPVFDRPLYELCKSKGFEEFIYQSMEGLRPNFSKQLDSGLVLNLLNEFCTEQHTAGESTENKIISLFGHVPEIRQLLEALKKIYFLIDTNRMEKGIVRLAHDSLAPIISNLNQKSDSPGYRANRVLNSKLREKEKGFPTELSKTDLKIIEGGREGMRRLTEHELAFINEESNRISQYEDELEAKNKIARRALSNTLIKDSEVAYKKENYVRSLRLVEKALEVDPSNPRVVQKAIDTYPRIDILREFCFHEKFVFDFDISSDKSKLITASHDHTACLWDLHGGLITVLNDHTDIVNTVRFSPSNRFLLTSSNDGTAKIWSSEGKLITTLEVGGGSVNSAEFSPDGKSILTSSHKGTYLWDLYGEKLKEMDSTTAIHSAIYSIDGQYIYTTTKQGFSTLWDRKGEKIRGLKGVNPWGGKNAFSPDNQFVLTGSGEGELFIWDINGNLVKSLKCHESGINSANFSDCGKRILTASDDTTAKVWDLEGHLISSFTAHEQSVWKARFIQLRSNFGSVSKELILTCSDDQRSILWSINGETSKRFQGNNARLIEKGRNDLWKPAVIICSDNKLSIRPIFQHNVKSNNILFHYNQSEWSISNVVESPDGQHFILIYRKTKISMGKKVRIELRKNDGTPCWKHDSDVHDFRDISFLPDSAHFIFRTWLDVHIFELAGVEAIFSEKGSNYCLSPRKNRIAIWTRYTIKLFSINGDLIREIPCLDDPDYGFKRQFTWVCFSPDGDRILGNCWGRSGIWDLEGTLLSTIGEDQDKGLFSPDGKLVLTVGRMVNNNTQANLWDASNGGHICEFRGHKQELISVAFSPDGNRVITTSTDYTAKIWTLNGSLIRTLEHNGFVYTPSFSKSGRFILTRSADRKAKLWTSDGLFLNVFENTDLAWFRQSIEQIVTISSDGEILFLDYNLEKIINEINNRGIAFLNDIELFEMDLDTIDQGVGIDRIKILLDRDSEQEIFQYAKYYKLIAVKRPEYQKLYLEKAKQLFQHLCKKRSTHYAYKAALADLSERLFALK